MKAYLLDNPTLPMICVAGIEHIDYDVAFQGPDGYQAIGDQLTVQIEAAIEKTLDLAWQQKLATLHAADGLKNAVEADQQLTSRLNDDGTITISQTPACDALRVTEYVGPPTSFQFESGKDALLATWKVEVIT